jgi:hypothetical protein
VRPLNGYLVRILLLGLASLVCQGATIERALNRMYNFDFSGADGEMDRYIQEHPMDPLGYSFRGAALVFRELDRLSILESEFVLDNKRIADKKKLTPDPNIKARFLAAMDQSKAVAKAKLASDGNDKNALFALCLDAGLITDYMALIEKRQLGSLTYARESHSYAVKLLKVDPGYTDAYLTTGLTEYLLGSVPFFVKWFVRFEEAEGNKKLAVERLNSVVTRGKYLGPFAKMMLAIIYLREKRPLQAEMKLVELSRDFPENQLFKKELEKLRPKLR